MDIDNATVFGDCPKPKKSKPSKCDQEFSTPNWSHLPSVVIYEIFDLLDDKDRVNAASVCKSWRQNLFHPKWWRTVRFEIEPNHIEKAKFKTSIFGPIVTNAKIKFNTLCPESTEELLLLLEAFTENIHLKELIIEPTHCSFDMQVYQNSTGKNCFNEISGYLELCIPSLTRFSIGCLEDFSYCLDQYLRIMAKKNPSKVTLLGFASVKEVPDEYEVCCLDPKLFRNFVNLKILSIDFDQLCDEFLNSLEKADNLERLVVHLHGLREGHPGTTNNAWKLFQQNHPDCELRLTVIHSYEEVSVLHEKILKSRMPLTHLKVFFCEMINLQVLEYLSTNYYRTLKSIMWIDSFSTNEESWIFVKPPNDDSPDALVLLAWLCKKLEEVVLYGYKYLEENLIAIARLRGEKLKRLEVIENELLVVKEACSPSENCLIDIPIHLKRAWAPIKTEDLHPVICNPVSGDSDEFLLPIVLADLH